MRKLALLVCLSMLPASAFAGDIVKEFSGTGNRTTEIFTVNSPWLLDWRLDGPGWRSNGSYEDHVALDITLIEVPSGRHRGRVLHTKFVGNGLKLFNDGGTYRLRISSMLARWTIKIEQIKPEEAEAYTPRKDN
ncbi:MAG: hypothetical protein IIB75_06770 [Proteobacteria bacterium]|nr:hypothetical protein [Pseudomonadota bacterium]